MKQVKQDIHNFFQLKSCFLMPLVYRTNFYVACIYNSKQDLANANQRMAIHIYTKRASVVNVPLYFLTFYNHINNLVVCVLVPAARSCKLCLILSFNFHAVKAIK